MSDVKINIIEYVDNSFPGWVRCVLTDAFGKEWFFTEKVPIVTTVYFDEKSDYPQNGVIRCIITKDNQEDNYIDIDTSKPDGVYSEDDKTIFTVLRNQLVDE